MRRSGFLSVSCKDLLTPLPLCTACPAVHHGIFADRSNNISVKGVKPVYRTTNTCRGAAEDLNRRTETGAFGIVAGDGSIHVLRKPKGPSNLFARMVTQNIPTSISLPD